MALNASSVNRETDAATGDPIGTRVGDVSGKQYQAVVLVDNAEAHQGLTANPLVTKLTDDANALISASNPIPASIRDAANAAINAANPLNVTSPVPGTTYNTPGALENQAQLKGSAGILRELLVIFTTGAARYVMLFDTTSAITGGQVPLRRFVIPAGPSSVAYAPIRGVSFSTGIRVATSTTAATWTDPTDSVCAFHADMD